MNPQLSFHLDTIQIGVERLRFPGVSPAAIIRHNSEIAQGRIIITRDRPAKQPWFAICGQDVRWATALIAMGLSRS